MEQQEVRYSKLSEEEAAEQFERRKQMFMKGLMQQHQLVSGSLKKQPNDRPPRPSSSNLNMKNSQSISRHEQPNEFVVLKQSQKKSVKTHMDLRVTNQKEMNLTNSKDIYGLQTINKNEIINRIESKQAHSQQKESIFTPNLKIQYKIHPPIINNRKIKTKKKNSVVSYESQQSVLEQQEQPRSIIPEPQSLAPSEVSSTQTIDKEKLLGQIGCLDLEIKRLMLEQTSESAINAAQSPSSSLSNLMSVKKVASSPYYEIRKRTTSKNRMTESQMSVPVKTTVDFYMDNLSRCSGYSAQKRVNDTANKSKCSQSSPKNVQQSHLSYNSTARQSEQSLNPIDKSDKKSQLQKQSESAKKLLNIKDMNLTNRQNVHISSSAHKSDKIVCTDRKPIIREKVTVPRSNSAMRVQEVSETPNYFLKSLMPFEEKYTHNMYLQQKIIVEYSSLESNGEVEQAIQWNIDIVQGKVNLSIRNNKPQIRKQSSFMNYNKQKQVDLQIDQAVKLYNNLRELITCKSGGVLKCFDKSQKKLATLDSFGRGDISALETRSKPSALFYDSGRRYEDRQTTQSDLNKITHESMFGIAVNNI